MHRLILYMYGAWFRRAREEAGLTRKDAAKRAKLSVDGLLKIESNANGASLATLEKLAGVYGVLVGDLLPNQGAMRAASAVPDDLAPIIGALEGMNGFQRRAVVTSMLAQAQMAQALLLAGGETFGGRVGKGAESDTPTDESGRVIARFQTSGGAADAPQKKGTGRTRRAEPKEGTKP